MADGNSARAYYPLRVPPGTILDGAVVELRAPPDLTIVTAVIRIPAPSPLIAPAGDVDHAG